MTDEEWKNLPVINGKSFSKYEVSSLGQIRNKKSGYVLSDKPKNSGYVFNTFYDDEGNEIKMSVHSVVARAFLGEPKSIDLTPDHINREPADNRLVNLRWATGKQQAANSDKSNRGRKGQPVIQYTLDMKEIKRWPNIVTAAKELGICSIGQTWKGKQKQAGGFKWAYERQNLDGEIWKKYIPGTLFQEAVEGVCDSLSLKPMGIQVSNMGRIKPPHCHIVYGSKASGGYLTYGKPAKLVHIMVAEAFLPNPKKKPEVNHKDKNGTNNKLENLEWATRSEQMIHSHKNSNPDRYSKSKAVKQYVGFRAGSNVEGRQDVCINEYRSIKEAARQTGCSATVISRMCLDESKSFKGFIFKYSNNDVLNQPSMKYTNKVDLIDEKENIIETYENVKVAASDLGISYHSVYNNLRGATKRTKDGYSFKYH